MIHFVKHLLATMEHALQTSIKAIRTLIPKEIFLKRVRKADHC